MEPRKVTNLLWLLTIIFFLLWLVNTQWALLYGMFFLAPLWGIWIFKNPEWKEKRVEKNP